MEPYDAARDAEGRLDYKGVIANGTKALEQANSHERLVNLYQMLGMAYAVTGHTDEAIDAFTKLLAVDPDHHMPRGLSPKINKPYQEAGGYWMDRPGGLAVVPDVPREATAQKPVLMSVRVDDPLAMAKTLRVSYRRSGDADFVKLEAPVGASNQVTIPAEAFPAQPMDYNVELYVAAVGPTGSELRTAGDALHPLTILVRAVRDNSVPPEALGGPLPPPKKDRGPIYKQWWLWTVVGVVVVGAAVGGGLGAYYGSDRSHVSVNVSSTVATGK